MEMTKFCPLMAISNPNGYSECGKCTCAWWDNDKCAVVALGEQLWYLRKDMQ